jgi:hypothetical protein
MAESTNTAKPADNDLVGDLRAIKRSLGQISHHLDKPDRARREIQQLGAEIDRIIIRYSQK